VRLYCACLHVYICEPGLNQLMDEWGRARGGGRDASRKDDGPLCLACINRLHVCVVQLVAFSIWRPGRIIGYGIHIPHIAHVPIPLCRGDLNLA